MATAVRQGADDLNCLIDEKVAKYGYADASAYVRDLISRDEERQASLEQAIEAGFASGPSGKSIDEIFEEVVGEIDRA